MNFLEALQKLRETRPRICILNARSENSDFSPYGGQNRNCYLCYGHGSNEDCYYIYWPYKNQDCGDCSYLYECEICYECVSCEKCYNCNFCQDCTDCFDCELCYDCLGCNNCFGCVGLRQKEYHLFNKKYSQTEYTEKIKEYNLENNFGRKKAQRKFEELQKQTPRLYSHQLNTINCVGDYIYNSQNCFCCWDVNHCEDCCYLNNLDNCEDSYDCNFGGSIPVKLCYECMSTIDLYNCNFCNTCWYSQSLEYCEYVFNSHDCFGCISLNHAEYCILNQKYSKDEYFKKVSKLKAEMKKQGLYGQHLESDYPEFLARLQ